MRFSYYALGDGEAWAVGGLPDRAEPMLLLFESSDVADRYCESIAGEPWQVMEIEAAELSEHVDSQGQLLLCTSFRDSRVDKLAVTLDDLERRHRERN